LENSLSISLIEDHRPTRALLEIGVCYALLLATLWSARPLRTYFGISAIAWMLIVLLFAERTAFSFGLGVKGLRESLWALGLAICAVTIVFLCAARLGTLRYHQMLSPRLPLSGYFVWSFIQQFVLQNLFFSRLLSLLRPSTAIFAGGLMLSLAHLPNPPLVIATLFWGLAACWLFFHYRNLYVIGIMHFLFGISLAMCVPTSLLPNMRVGHGYIHCHDASRAAPAQLGSARSAAPQQKPRQLR
jgi:hypothetical protein